MQQSVYILRFTKNAEVKRKRFDGTLYSHTNILNDLDLASSQGRTYLVLCRCRDATVLEFPSISSLLGQR